MNEQTLRELLPMATLVGDDEYRKRRESLKPHDVVNMQYTSGTIGFHKGVMLTH